MDDVPEEDVVSLPYQGYPNGRAGADESIMSGSYDSTHFDRHSNPDLLGSVQRDASVNSDYYQVTTWMDSPRSEKWSGSLTAKQGK